MVSAMARKTPAPNHASCEGLFFIFLKHAPVHPVFPGPELFFKFYLIVSMGIGQGIRITAYAVVGIRRIGIYRRRGICIGFCRFRIRAGIAASPGGEKNNNKQKTEIFFHLG